MPAHLICDSWLVQPEPKIDAPPSVSSAFAGCGASGSLLPGASMVATTSPIPMRDVQIRATRELPRVRAMPLPLASMNPAGQGRLPHLVAGKRYLATHRDPHTPNALRDGRRCWHRNRARKSPRTPPGKIRTGPVESQLRPATVRVRADSAPHRREDAPTRPLTDARMRRLGPSQTRGRADSASADGA